MSESDLRHLYAKNRWRVVWVLLWDCIKHPNSARVIHIGGACGATTRVNLGGRVCTAVCERPRGHGDCHRTGPDGRASVWDDRAGDTTYPATTKAAKYD